jgi:TonB family protein
MNSLMRQGAVGILLLAGSLVLSPNFLPAQESTAKRRLLQQSAAPYPALARSMALQGVVKVEALVAPDGTVKDVEIKGGHPVLAQAAVKAVRGWRWEPSPHESREIVEVKFAARD